MGDWRGGETELSSLLARLFASRTNLFADVSLVCEENMIVPAHKLVLALTSQYFQVFLVICILPSIYFVILSKRIFYVLQCPLQSIVIR